MRGAHWHRVLCCCAEYEALAGLQCVPHWKPWLTQHISFTSPQLIKLTSAVFIHEGEVTKILILPLAVFEICRTCQGFFYALIKPGILMFLFFRQPIFISDSFWRVEASWGNLLTKWHVYISIFTSTFHGVQCVSAILILPVASIL